jgi:hypothetical protein
MPGFPGATLATNHFGHARYAPPSTFWRIIMSFFGSILSKIFPSDHPANQQAHATPAGGAAAAPAAGAPAPAATAAAGTPSKETAGAQTPASALPVVDVEQVLSGLAAKQGQPLNWQTSIVDLLKLLSLDSSLEARKGLAHELHYTGDTNDSAQMNVWLHKAVMTQLEANGGKVPANLKN